MALTGFEEVNQIDVETADASTSIKDSNSPFQHNVQFTISGYTYVKVKNDGVVDKDARSLPVFKTSVGNLFLSTIIRSQVKSDGSVATPNGTFNEFVKRQIAEKSTNKEIMSSVVQACQGKQIRVTRVPYAGLTRDNRPIAKFLVQLDFV